MEKRILIVDDEPDLRELIAFHLHDPAVACVTAGNCAEALALAATAPPDLVLLDILLPDVDGLTLCEMLKRLPAFRDVPIAMMSAHDSAPTRQRANAAGAVEFFAKPFNLAMFRARVKQLLAAPLSLPEFPVG